MKVTAQLAAHNASDEKIVSASTIALTVGRNGGTMTAIEERKAKYENSALRILLESQGHEICRRCYCCEFVWERATCWACGGMEDDDPDLYVIAVCSECNGEGETSFQVCIGRCDENGNHARKQTASGQGSMTSQSKPQTMPEERESGKGVREDG